MRPVIDETVALGEKAFVAPGASVVGDVELGRFASVWYGAVIRGDEGHIRVGACSNVQDNCVLHGKVGIGEGATIGHGAIVHGCEIGDNSLVGMGAIVLDGARIGKDCIIGAGALVTQGKEIPDGMLAFGSPAKVIRALTPDEIEANRQNARHYVELASRQPEGRR